MDAVHFIFSPIGSAGDVHPMLGLALAMRERGHDVTFVANGYFRSLVEKFGFEPVELGTEDEAMAAIRHPDLWKPTRALSHIARSVLQPMMRRQYEIFAEHYRPGETVGVASCLGLGALIAREKLGLPLVTLHLQPAVLWSDVEPPTMPGTFGPRWMQRLLFRVGERFFVDPVILPAVNDFRRELGLDPVQRHTTQWWNSPDGVVCLFPEWFAPQQPDWPRNLVLADFPLWDEGADDPLSGEVERFLNAGAPPVVFTPGSANVFGKNFFEAAAGACNRLGLRGILLTRFPEQIPDKLSLDVAYFEYVPLRPLLARSLALVHHGGIGTTAQGLAAGIPQIIMPLAHDQYDNVARLQRLGVGDKLMPRRFRASTLAAKLERLLGSENVADACDRAAELTNSGRGLAAGADALEDFGRRLCGNSTVSAALESAGERGV